MSTPALPLRSHTFNEYKASIQGRLGMLVEQMIQERTVNIIVGDSGIGKSPMLQQIALCVATGKPFLNLKTRPAKVLSIDFENSADTFTDIIENLHRFLGIKEPVPNFRILTYPETKAVIESEIKAFKPELVIIDALRGLDPKAEKDAEAAMFLLDWLHKKAAKYHTSFLILHHTRKPDQKDPPPKLTALSQPMLTWLHQASGSRALINQTEARFAIEECSVGESALIMRGHLKLSGEVGPWYIERVLDDEADVALGYRRVSDSTLLKQSDREKFFLLPQTFTWAEAEASLNVKRGKSLSRLLAIYRSTGMIEKHGTGRNVHYTRCQ